MSLICALSNEVPETPVVSPVSGSIFEKRLIVKYISEHGNDPINGNQLTEDMLVEIKAPAIIKPKAPSATSVPAILKTLQDEWDATVLHAFTLRQQLQAARQELSHALYQHDAACRVIARLTKEVTAAREALATLKPKTDPNVSIQNLSNSINNGDHSMEEPRPEVGITPEILEKLETKAAVLTADRKARARSVPEGLADIDTIKSMITVASHTGLHSASTPGILSIDICPHDDSKIISGGADRVAIVFDKNAGQVVSTLKGHTKKITSVIYHPNTTTAITASHDASIRVWDLASSNTTHVVSAHAAGISAISLHATGDYLLSTSTDEFWAFSDLNTGVMLCRVGDPTSAHALTTAQFHPDGLIFGTGTTDSLMKIWDLKEKSNVANFPGHTGAISAMAFSENGYYLATAAEDSSVRLWDLRKLRNFKIIKLQDNYEVKDLCFDNSGTYLAVAGTDVRVYHTKQWDNLTTFEDHTGLATGVRFGDNANFIVSSSLDRSLKVYASNVK